MQRTEKYFERDAFRTGCESVILAAEPDEKTGGGRIALDGTVFYPEGGGQPADQGTLTLPDGTVLQVQDVHEQAGVIWHTVDALPAAAAPGAAVAGCIDWDWRSIWVAWVWLHAALELAGADAHKSDAVAVGLVHVGLNLKDECRELVAAGVHGLTGQAVHAGQRGGGEPQEVLQKGLHAKVGQGRTKEHGAQLAAQHLVEVKFLGSTVQQLDLIHLLHAVGAAVAGKCQHLAGVAVEYALELLAAADGPVHVNGLLLSADIGRNCLSMCADVA